MADIKVARHPQKKTATLIFNDVKRDIYRDSIREEEARCVKDVIVRKNPDMTYIQDMFYGELLEDTDKIPWVILVTVSNLPRLPKNDDMVLLQTDGVDSIYSISAVKPMNRDVPVILSLLVYPERTET